VPQLNSFPWLAIAIDHAGTRGLVAKFAESISCQIAWSCRPDELVDQFKRRQVSAGWPRIDALIVSLSGATCDLCRDSETPFLFVASQSEGIILKRASDLGATAIVTLSDELPCWYIALESCCRGDKYISPIVQMQLRVSAKMEHLWNACSNAEQQTLRLLASGDDANSIAKKLYVKERSARRYISALEKRFGVSGVVRLVRIADALGLAEFESPLLSISAFP